MQMPNRLFPRISVATGQDIAKATSPSTQMAVALRWRNVYGGTVPAEVVAKRRARNKAARIARRAHRKAAR